MSLKGKRIFIVEDDSLNRVVYKVTLGIHGAVLDFDRWGREAINRLEKSMDWDLIILDLMLQGGVTGYDIFEAIRALPRYDSVPIIAVSASDPSTAIPKARQLGFSGFISKPVDEATFPDQVLRVINGEEVWADDSLPRF